MAIVRRCLIWSATLFGLCTLASPLDARARRDVVQIVRIEISKAEMLKRDDIYKTKAIPLNKIWDNFTLLKLGVTEEPDTSAGTVDVTEEISFVWTHCYLSGTGYGQLLVPDNFDATQAVNDITDELKDTITEFTQDAEQYMQSLAKEVGESLFNHHAFVFPNWDYAFDVDVPDIPEVSLRFTVEDLELYMAIDTTLTLGSTYTIPLYESQTGIRIQISPSLSVGVISEVDLILDAQASVGISSGFHLKLESLAIDIPLFGDTVSNIAHNGGHIEFLPVTVESAGGLFTTTLRVGVHSGFDVQTPYDLEIFDVTLSFGGGIEAVVFADIAEFTTNVTYQPQEDCELGVAQSYQMALGATAGAWIEIDANTWGPVATTSVPIFATELDSACATSTTPTAAATPLQTWTAMGEGEDLVTSTITTQITHTGISCLSTGLVNCPVSLQSTSKSVETTTFVTIMPSGAALGDVTTLGIQSAVASPVAFGRSSVTMAPTSGSPMPYVPPRTTSIGSPYYRVESYA